MKEKILLKNRWKGFIEKQKKFWKKYWTVILIITIVAIPFFIVFISTYDLTPATRDDYLPLYEQVDILKEDIDNIWSMDNASVNISEHTITLFSEECNIDLTLDDNRNIIFIKEIDNCDASSVPLRIIIILPLIIASYFCSLVSFLLFGIIFNIIPLVLFNKTKAIIKNILK